MTDISNDQASDNGYVEPPPGYLEFDHEHLTRENPYTGLKRFFVFSSGAEPQILRHAPSEQNVFIALGGTVVATGVLAFVSMTFALSMAFESPWYVAAPAGIVWGLIIYNLDRWLVASYRPLGSVWATMVSVIPRVALAVLFGLIISEPLILRIFDDEIEQEIVDINAETQSQRLEDLESGPLAQQITDAKSEEERLRARLSGLDPSARATNDPVVVQLRDDVDKLAEQNAELSSQIADARIAVDTAEDAYIEEVESGCRAADADCRPGRGDKAIKKEEVLAQARIGLENVQETNQPVIATNNERITQLEADIDERVSAIASSEIEDSTITTERATINEQLEESKTEIRDLEEEFATQRQNILDNSGSGGLLVRVEALEQLRSDSPQVNLLYRLFQLLFVAVDTIPIIGKVIYSMGEQKSYDRLRHGIEQSIAHDIERATQARTIELAGAADIETYRRAASAANQQHLVNYAAQIQRNLGEGLLRQWETRNLPTDTNRVDPANLPPITVEDVLAAQTALRERLEDGSSHRESDSAGSEAGRRTKERPPSESAPIVDLTTSNAAPAGDAHGSDTSSNGNTPRQPEPEPRSSSQRTRAPGGTIDDGPSATSPVEPKGTIFDDGGDYE